jgi:hypothetical protein
MHKNLPTDVKAAITTLAQAMLEGTIIMIDRDEIRGMDGCYRFIEESHFDGADDCELNLDDQLTLLEYHADDYDLSIKGISVEDLRTTIEELALELVSSLAQTEALSSISELEEIIDVNGFEFDEITASNPYAGATHRRESELNGCTIYEYRNLEGEIHADVWEKELAGGVKVFLIRTLEPEHVSEEERSWTEEADLRG